MLLVHVPGFEPGAEPGIEDLRLAAPKIWTQTTLNAQMIELQLDDGNVFREIAPDIMNTDVQSGNAVGLALGFNHHTHLPGEIG